MQRSSPFASAGLRMFEASIEPPDAAPAPMMVWISSMKRIAPGFCLSASMHALEALLEVAAVPGAGEQRAHVERVDRAVAQDVRHLALEDAQREAFGDGGLADARLADEERVVLAAAAQDLDRALDLVAGGRSADRCLPCSREPVQVDGVLLERVAARTRRPRLSVVALLCRLAVGSSCRSWRRRARCS